MEMRLHQVSTTDVKRLLVETKRELERLKKRFSRKSISVQVFGMAGSGKSTFIQSVTGNAESVGIHMREKKWRNRLGYEWLKRELSAWLKRFLYIQVDEKDIQ